MPRWRVDFIGKHIGSVEAPDGEAAITAAAKQFGITSAGRDRIVVKMIDRLRRYKTVGSSKMRFAIIAVSIASVAALLTFGAVMNRACKSDRELWWCAPARAHLSYIFHGTSAPQS